MAIKTILLAAIATTFVAAVPQHAEHIGKAQIARSNQLFARDLTERTVSQDGSCGSWSGLTCPGSNCCSSIGWCGATPLHCGTGCQSEFGQCGTGSGSETDSTPASSEPVVVVTTQVATTVAPAVATAVVVPSNVNNPVVQQHHAPAPVSWSEPAATTPTTTPVTTPTTTATPAAATTSSGGASQGSNAGLGDVYKLYTGDGSTAEGWPSQSEWADFDTLFANNKGIMQQSCTQFGSENNSDDEINAIKTALTSAASTYNVDSRFLLAIMMQESGGCVRAPTTNYGVRNPGLFQSHNGKYTCNEGGNVQNPCPSSEISGMVSDGVDGTASYLGSYTGGDGLVQTLSESQRSDVSKYYRAARIYNSGSIASSGQLQDGIATHCYSSDVANRLTGWVHAAHGCSQ